MANVRQIPIEVSVAILRGDTKALEAMGAAGNRKKKRLRQAALTAKARADAQRQAEEVRRAAEEAEIEAVLEREYQQVLRSDAYRHALRNLAGWKQD